MKQAFRKRVRYLWTFELFNALVVFPLAYYSLWSVYDLGWFSLVALAVVCAMLLVGAVLWLLQGRQTAAFGRSPQRLQRLLFRVSRLAFGAALSAMLALFLGFLLVAEPVSFADLAVGGGLLVLALLEYINYYFVQLMYDNRADIRYLLRHRRLKRAAMARILES